MTVANPDLKGPVLVITSNRGRGTRVRELLAADRFEVIIVSDGAAALGRPATSTPTVVLLDWASESDPEELVYRLRPRRAGPRVLAIADPAHAKEIGLVTGVAGVVAAALDPEDLVDQVWRCHHDVVFARSTRSVP